jgi:hypothetical protein
MTQGINITPMNMLDLVKRSRWLWSMLCVGILLRIWALHEAVLINPDGAIYIYQAEMLAKGRWHQMTSCGLSFISIYPFLIAGMHRIAGDWILAAQLISILFSAASLIPIYLICRRFFDAPIAATTALLAAMNPVMCSLSGGVVRDPIYWFFMAWGIYLVLLYWGNRSRYVLLPLASIAFVLALWARIEASLPLILTAVCLPFLGKEGLWRRLAAYAWPLVILGLGVLFSMMILKIPMDRLLRLNELISKATSFAGVYHQIGNWLIGPISDQLPAVFQEFLRAVRNNMWLVAIGVMINRTLEAFFYPFVPLFVVGLPAFRSLSSKDSRWFYFLLYLISGYVLLYVFLLTTWIMEYRYLMLIFIPSLPFAAAGIAKLNEAITTRWHFEGSKVLTAMFLVLLLCGIPKNILHSSSDKVVFRQIADTIVKVQGSSGPAVIACSGTLHLLLSFYANIDQADPPCPMATCDEDWSKYADAPGKLESYLKQNHFNFFIYEGRHWHGKEFHPENASGGNYFELIGQWYHRDTGQIRVYHLH